MYLLRGSPRWIHLLCPARADRTAAADTAATFPLSLLAASSAIANVGRRLSVIASARKILKISSYSLSSYKSKIYGFPAPAGKPMGVRPLVRDGVMIAQHRGKNKSLFPNFSILSSKFLLHFALKSRRAGRSAASGHHFRALRRPSGFARAATRRASLSMCV